MAGVPDRVKLNFLVEGQTEETFVKTVLQPHLKNHSVDTEVRCVVTRRTHDYEYRGGLNAYRQVKSDLTRWMKDEPCCESRFTTMFDLYRIPKDFPGYRISAREPNPYDRTKEMERAMVSDLGDGRLMPYIQLHEFEALLLVDAGKLAVQFPDRISAIQRIFSMAESFPSPELIDDVDGPSKRIIREIPEYEDRKAAAGPIVAERIGLPTLRAKCSHFGCWIETLEALAHPGVGP